MWVTNELRTVVVLLGLGLATAPVTAQDDDWLTEASPAVPDYQQLLERLSALETEVSTLRTQPQTDIAITPANLDYLPPSPSMTASEFGFAPAVPAAPPPKKYPIVNVNGVFQADTMYFSQDTASHKQYGDLQDGADFRRTRLSASGSVAENVNYFVQMDFGFFGRPTYTDVWGEVTQVPFFGNVRVGQWKQPFSLEVPTSFRYQTFMERSVLFQSFEAFRHIGAGFYNNNEDLNWTWAASVFRVGNDQFGDDIGDAGGWSTAARATHLWWYCDYQDECKRLEYLHTGASFWFGDPGNDLFRYRTIPEMFMGAFGSTGPTGTSGVAVPNTSNGTPAFVDTGNIATNTFTHIGTEALWAHGPFAWQNELQMATVAQTGGPYLHFWGFYSEWMYFLTGESKPYNRKLGQIDRIVPLRPFIRDPNCEWGPGAWEFAMRISHIDLDSENIHGGRLTDFTLGLNWYLNGYTKMQVNYVRAMVNREFAAAPRDSSTDIFGVRFQLDF